MNEPRIGSWCSGYRGLDMAVEEVFGGTTAWVSDVDPGANAILAHHWPDTPNIGDLTTADYQNITDQYGNVGIVAGGYPCQPFSVAGNRKGTEDDRHIWPYIADALGVLRPRVAVFENVANHLRLGFADVLADFARLGFHVEWCLVRASEVEATHHRNRLIILAIAEDAHGSACDQWGVAAPGQAEGRWSRSDARGRDRALVADTDHQGSERPGTAGREQERHASGDDRGHAGIDASPDTDRTGLEVGGVEPDGEERPATERGGHEPSPDTDKPGGERAGDARERRTGPAHNGHASSDPTGAGREGTLGERRRSPGDGSVSADSYSRGLTGVQERDGRQEDTQPERVSQGDADRCGVQREAVDWGRFGPAIRRWERATGRRAPRATDDRNRLSPAFVEWMMGLPTGHVTGVPGLTRTAQLKALGNGVVPQQASAALRLLAERSGWFDLTPQGVYVPRTTRKTA